MAENSAPTSWANLFGAISSLTPAQSAALVQLAQHREPTTIAELAEEAGLHQNSVRENLNVLIDQNLAGRVKLASEGPGRPSWGYFATAPEDTATTSKQLAWLAESFVHYLTETSDDPAAQAMQIGRNWAEHMLKGFKVPDHAAMGFDGAVEASRLEIHMTKVRAFLSTQGYSAHLSDREEFTVELRSCPFVDAEGRVNPLMCQIHLGMLSEVLEVTSRGHIDVEVTPFAAPGVCDVHLVPAGGTAA